jgi:hypothetical protein
MLNKANRFTTCEQQIHHHSVGTHRLDIYYTINNPLIGENYHKTLEFMSTGKVIISHCFSSYKNKPQLLQMDCNATNNSNLPDLFKAVIQDLQIHNTEELSLIRKNYAKDNLYQKQLDRIEAILQQHLD